MYRLNNLIHNTGISKSTRITQLIFLASQDLSQNTSHDLSRTRLWQILHDDDTLGCGKWTNCLADLENEFFGQLWSSLDVIFQRDEGIDG